ncbi:Retrovirus-related Pol polyprotein from transposon RE1 [Bienertia sinuspersici]
MTEKEKEISENVYNDPLFLSPNESTQMQLSPMLFDGNNFIPWSRSVKIALGAKNKMGFIDGKKEKPHYNSKDYPKWLRNDHMVRCWIFRSMKEDVALGFSLVESAKQLWDELNERYSQSNAPLLYQLKIDLGKIEQEEMSVSEYYGKLKKIFTKIPKYYNCMHNIRPISYVDSLHFFNNEL